MCALFKVVAAICWWTSDPPTMVVSYRYLKNVCVSWVLGWRWMVRRSMHLSHGGHRMTQWQKEYGMKMTVCSVWYFVVALAYMVVLGEKSWNVPWNLTSIFRSCVSLQGHHRLAQLAWKSSLKFLKFLLERTERYSAALGKICFV